MITKSQNLPMTAGIAAAVGGPNAANAPELTQDITAVRQETQIWTTFALNPYLRAYDLKVTVSQSRATLHGTVAEEANKDLARNIALGVAGISSVENLIEVVAQFVPPVVTTGDRAFGELVDDTTVTSAVRSKLAWSRYADGLRANVATTRGKVHLTGHTTTAEGKEAAGRLAMSTHGVRSVTNDLEIQPGVVTSIGGELADGWITMKVKSTLLYSTHVAGRDIEVGTQGGVVKLTGKIASETERALAVELAGNVRGVKSVDSSSLTI
jgi:osmotically-inducible protein OsmY